MKRFFTLIILSILACGYAMAYDFSAVCSSGQTLYYTISDMEPYTVEVTSELDGFGYNSSPEGNLEIPESVEYNSITYPVTGIGTSAFMNCTGLTSVTIPNSVTYIGMLAFQNCSELTSVTIGNSVASIANSAFSMCIGLTNITIPSSVTSIEELAFSSCSRLEFIVVESGNSTYDSRENCNAIIETATNKLVLGCANTIILNSVTGIGNYAFQDIIGLTSISIPNSVTSIGNSAFESCHNMTEITVPNSVTEIGMNAFSGCSGLTEITIPNSVTSIGVSAFSNCNGLTSVTIGSSVTEIGDLAFSDCWNISVINISANTPPNLGDDVFTSTIYSTATLNVPNGSIDVYENANGWSNFQNIRQNSETPTVTTLPCEDIESHSVTLNAAISGHENVTILDVGFIYATSTAALESLQQQLMINATVNEGYIIGTLVDDEFTADVYGLSSNTDYYYLAFVRYSDTEEHILFDDTPNSFRTTDDGTAGNIIFEIVQDVHTTSDFTMLFANLSGFSSTAGYTAWGFWYGTTPDASEYSVHGQFPNGNEYDRMYALVNGLMPSTTYYFKAYIDSHESGVVSFTTEPSPSIIVSAYEAEVNGINVTLHGYVSNVSVVSEYGFYYGHHPEVLDQYVSADYGETNFSSLINVAEGMEYFYKAYAMNGGDYIYSSVSTFTAGSTSNGTTHEYVDLGLPSGTLWATTNIGADQPSDYGNYYSWGSVTYPGSYESYDWTEYNLCDGTSATINKYCTIGDYGTVDNITTLATSDDAATVNWGENWRMPTSAEFQELITNCTWEWSVQDGKEGYLVSGNGNSIFLPAAGYMDVSGEHSIGTDGNYWSSSLREDAPTYAMSILFYSGTMEIFSQHERPEGLPIRPVYAPSNTANNQTDDVLFHCDFEDAEQNSLWSLNTTSQANFWYIGSAVSNGGSNALYITHDGGASNEYDTNNESYSYATIQVWIGEADNYQFDFDWMANGEYNYDNMRAFLVSLDAVSSFVDGSTYGMEGDNNTTPAGWIDLYSESGIMEGQTSWQHNSKTVALEEGGYNLVFFWKNNVGGGFDPPAAVDNIVVSRETQTANNQTGTFIDDRDGRTYNYVVIGDQTWMAENLRYDDSGSMTVALSNEESDTDPYLYYPNGDSQNLETYGYLYNWPAAMNGESSSDTNPSGVQGICPEGWHLPSEAEWVHLSDYLGGTENAGAMLAGNANLWNNAVITESSYFGNSSFNALPAGFYESDNYTSFGSEVYFWTATESESVSAYGHYIVSWETSFNRDSYDAKQLGFSVRCVKDAENTASNSTGSHNGHDYVDLGLSVKWATMNIGAEAPDEEGNLYAWGETETKSMYDWINYEHCEGYESMINKYFTDEGIGVTAPDNLTTLLPEDDAVTVSWGAGWRMPTADEVQELINNCTIEGSTISGNDNSITLNNPRYWTSSLYLDDQNNAYTYDNFSGAMLSNAARYNGYPVRGVYDATLAIPGVVTDSASNITPTSVYFYGTLITEDGVPEATEFGFKYGTDSQSLTETIQGENGTVGFIATLTGLSEGTIYYYRAYATNINGTGYGEIKSFTTPSGAYGGHYYIDLGLSSGTLWATTNVGASTPEGFGDYYAWGETEPKSEYTWSTYQHATGTTDDNVRFTKYCTDAAYGENGFVDNLTTLELEDDAASVNWGTGWRMPMHDEISELVDNCTWVWDEPNGIGGYRVTGRNGNSIFLPASGLYHESTLISDGTVAYYWSNTLGQEPIESSTIAMFTNNYYVSGVYRYLGYSVRAIFQKSPTVMTNSATNITTTTATLQGKIASSGISDVTARGFIYGTDSENLTDSIASTDNTDEFSVSISNLESGRRYYFKAFAANSDGVSYGTLRSLRTLGPPDVTMYYPAWRDTTSVSLKASVEAIGEISTNKFYIGTDRSSLAEVNGEVFFSNSDSTITVNVYDLLPETLYWAVAESGDEYGSRKGDTISFYTYGHFKDARDNTDYRTIKIGDQTWMAENLRFATDIQVGADTSSTVAYRYYPAGDEANTSTYGYLYNWKAAMNGANSSEANPSGVQGICPDGWHLPSNSEWTQLETALGSSKTGSKLAGSASTWICNYSSCDMLNDKSFGYSGFNAVPSGVYYQNYYVFGQEVAFWSTSRFNETNIYTRYLYTNRTELTTSDNETVNGYNVRCLKNIDVTVATNSATNLASISAILHGSILNAGSSEITDRGFMFGTDSTSLTQNLQSTDNTADFTYTLSDLTANRTYYFKAYATVDGETKYGEVKAFMTPSGVYDNYAYVDLGLPSGAMWATCNVGASNPEDYGNYYAWGETTTKDSYTQSNYTYSDNPTTLPAEADAVAVNWGGRWFTPTVDDLEELNTNCTSEWTSVNGVYGRVFTGPNGNSIFLPAAGRFTSTLGSAGSYGDYWSSSLYNDNSGASYLYFNSSSNNATVSFTGRYYGYSVRGIYRTVPTVATLSATDVSSTSAVLHGRISDIGNSEVTARGFKFGTSSDNLTETLTSTDNTDEFSYTVSDLEAGRTYFFRAFATNSDGTSYGEIKILMVSGGQQFAGHEYIDLGLPSGIMWATCNVGATSPEDQGDKYAWGETTTKDSYTQDNYTYSDIPEILPADHDAAVVVWGGGWRTPTSADFEELINNCTLLNTDLNDVDGYVFTGPNGNSIFIPRNYYWSSSIDVSTQANAYALSLNTTGATVRSSSRYYGDYIRGVCSIPEVALSYPVWRDSIAVSLKAKYTVNGTVQSYKYYTGTAKNSLTEVTEGVTISSNEQLLTVNIYDLSPRAEYWAMAEIVDEYGTYRSDTLSFYTYGSFVDSRNNTTYYTIQIGEQTWMAENLKYAGNIPVGTDTSSTIAYRYYPNGDEANVTTYGYLYNWLAAINGEASSEANPSGVQGICPIGWHFPSEDEWIQLANALGGTDSAGAQLAGSSELWDSGTLTNSTYFGTSGFNALPAGNYFGVYYDFGSDAVFWSATESNSSDAYRPTVDYNYANLYRYGGGKKAGFSVRCVKGTTIYAYDTVNYCGEQYTFGTQTLTADGDYEETFHLATDKDSVVYLHLTMHPALTATVSGFSNGCYNANNGTIEILASNGTPDYTYAWTDADDNAVTCNANGNLSELGAGTYTLTVTDAAGCTATVSQTLTAPAELLASIEGENPSCHGGSTTLTADANNGTPDAYSWGSGESTASITVSPTATTTYTVTITDANGCTASTSVTISQPDLLTASLTAGEIACNGGTTNITNTVEGGTSDYTYSWGSGETTQNLENVTAGTYNVTVTDANSCSATASVTISQPDVLTASLTAGTIACNGSTTNITNTVEGGTPDYTYSWGSGETSQNLTGVTAGTYTVTITDANGCTASTSVTISQPDLLTASLTAGEIACNGSTTNITNTVEGGTPDYSYYWSDDTHNQNHDGVSAGNYTVTVQDANGCSATSSIAISQPDALTSSLSPTEINCHGETANITNTVTGGNEPYQFAWSNNATSQSLTGVSGGTYGVTVTDANGCTATASVTINEPAELTSALTAGSAGCNGGTANITNTVTGGTEPITYAWSNGANTQSLTGVVAGEYTVTVTDAKGCSLERNAEITQPEILTVTLNAGTIACNGETTTISTSIAGGTTPYTYAWNNDATTENLANAVAGTYSVTVTDANTCATSTAITITQPDALSVSISGPTSVCENTTSTLTANVQGGTPDFTYLWNDGTATSSITTPQLTVATEYSVTVTDANNCSASASVNVEIGDTPGITISDVTAICVGGNTILQANVSNAGSDYTVEWSSSDTGAGLPDVLNTDAITVTPTTAGTYTYTVSLTATSCSDGQPFTSSDNVQLLVNGLPDAAITNNTNETTITCSTTQISLTATGGTAYQWSNGGAIADNNITTAGTYTVTVTDANGCSNTESIVITENVAAPTVNIINETGTTLLTCTTTTINVEATGTGTSYLWSNEVTTATNAITTGGTYTVTATADNGCTSTAAIEITPNADAPTVSITNNSDTTVLTCSLTSINVTATGSGTSYQWSNGANTAENTLTAPGTYTVTATAGNGCSASDQITITQNITAPDITATATESAICQGESTTISATGGESYTWSPETGLPSTVGASLTATPTATTTYTVTGVGTNGCTGSGEVVITVNLPTSSEFTETACDLYTWNGTNYTESGDFQQTFPNANGCDSVVTLHLTINSSQTNTVEVSACDSYEWAGETYTATGNYEHTFQTLNGCDSVVTLNLTINNSQTNTVEVSACESYEWNGNTYTETGEYNGTFTAANGCDSIVTLHLTINHTVTGIDRQEACESFTWIDGVTYTESTDSTDAPTFTLQNAEGCDSVVSLYLVVNYSTTSEVSAQMCSGVPYVYEGQTFTESGTYTVTLTNSHGCDSIVTLTITYANNCGGIVSGIVTDENTGDAISNARVTIGNKVTRTNAEGQFSLEVLRGRKALRVSATGYISHSRSVDIQSDTVFNISLNAPHIETDVDSLTVSSYPYLEQSDSITLINTGSGTLVWSSITEYDNLALIEDSVIQQRRNTRSLWDSIQTFATRENAEQAISTDGFFIYTSSWMRPGEFNRYTPNGEYVETFYVENVGSIRNLSYDGTHFYGTEGTNIIFKLDLDNQTLVDSIETDIQEIRHCSFNKQDGSLLAGSWNSLYRIDIENGTSEQIRNDLANVYSSAFDNLSPGGPYLWLFSQTSQNNGPSAYIRQFNISTGEYTDRTHYLDDINLGSSSLAGGICASEYVCEGKFVLLADVQNPMGSNTIATYEIGRTNNVVRTGKKSGTIAPNSSENISVKASATETGDYSATIKYRAAVMGTYSRDIDVNISAVAPECDAVQQITIATDTFHTVTLDWQPVELGNYESVSYLVFNTASQFAIDTVSGTTVTYDGLPVGEHCFCVMALSQADYTCLSAASDTVCAEIQDIPCNIPLIVEAKSEGETIKVSWNMPVGVDYVSLYRYEEPLDEHLTTTSYIDSDVVPETDYCYIVIAHFENSVCNEISGYACIRIAADVCTEAPVLTANAVSGSVALEWSESNGAVNYRIFRNDTFVGATSGTSYIDNVSVSGEYCYRVESICEYGMFASSDEVCLSVEIVEDDGSGEGSGEGEGDAIDEWTADNLTLYPNPTYGQFFIEGQRIAVVQIFNASGMLVTEIENTEDERITINCEGWNPGLYNIRIISAEGETATRKVTIFR